MKVVECMARDVVSIEASEGLPKALSAMTEHRIRHLPVVERKRLVGVLSERDLLEATGWDPQRAFDQAEKRERPVRDVMTVPPETTDPEAGLAEAAELMLRRHIGCLPVLEDGKLVGILSEYDVLGAFARAASTVVLSEELDPTLDASATDELVTIDTGATVAEALERCRTASVRHLPVRHDGWFVGLVSDRDLRLEVGQGREDQTRVEEIMTRHVVRLPPTSRLSEAAALMVEERIGCIVVTDADKRLLGLVSTRDALARSAAAIPELG